MIFYTIINVNASASEQHEAAYGLLAESLKRLYGIESFSLIINNKGKPFLKDHPNIFFNLSHCAGMAVCGISTGEIGVDAELIRTHHGNGAKRIFSESEINFISESTDPDESFFRLWTLKEALGKSLGSGITSDLKEREFTFSNGTPFCGSVPEKIFTQKIILNRWVVSVCANYTEEWFEQI